MRKLAAFPILIATAFAATGWLYLVRPALPGPRLGEALPLDELAKHSSAPLLWFAVVWLVAAIALGLYARSSGFERLTSALLLGVGIGLFGYLQTGVSIAVVRQVSLRDALDSAARLQSVYLPAAFVALAVAALAPARNRGRRAPLLVATVVAVGAVLNLVHTILPGDDTGLLHSFTPDAVGPLARAAGALAGVALLVAARGLARRRQRAWQVATVVAGASTALHVLNGLNHGTLASAIVLVLLVARRHDFDRPGDASTRHMIVARVALASASIAFFAIVALWVNQTAADQPLTLQFTLREMLGGLLGLNLHGSPHLSGSFGYWFPLSLLLLGIAATAWIVAGWLAPWRYRVGQQERERAIARALVHAWGVDTLAPFVLRADKSYFFNADETAFLAYRVVGCVAIVSGDPIGPRERLDDLVSAFVELAHARDWRVAILGASEGFLPLYAARGLHALYHGDEAVVETASFALDGRAIRKVRQSVHRLEHAGYRARGAPTERARCFAAGGARGRRACVARRCTRARVRDGARRSVRSRGRGCSVLRRLRAGR